MSNAKIRARRRRRARGYKGSPPAVITAFDIETILPELLALMPPHLKALVRFVQQCEYLPSVSFDARRGAGRDLAKIRNFGLGAW